MKTCHLDSEEQAEVFIGRMKEKQEGSELQTLRWWSAILLSH